MPFVPSTIKDEVKPPSEPHLGVFAGQGEIMAFPRGAVFVIVESPTEPGKQLPMALVKVDRRVLTFRCPCGDKHCTLVYTWRMKRSGRHSGVTAPK